MRVLLFILLIIVAPLAAQACGTTTTGNLTVTNAWSRATIGADRPGAFYVEIRNSGAEDDALISLATPVAGMPMLHKTVMKDGVASMPHAPEITIPAGDVLRLSPGGFHGMLMDLVAPLKEGDRFPVTLSFRQGGSVTIDAQVQSIRSKADECAGAQ